MSAKKVQETSREALKNSRNFLLIADRNTLARLRDDEQTLTRSLLLAKQWSKPTYVIVNGLSDTEEKELLTYLAGHDVKKVYRRDMSDHRAIEKVADELVGDIGERFTT